MLLNCTVSLQEVWWSQGISKGLTMQYFVFVSLLVILTQISCCWLFLWLSLPGEQGEKKRSEYKCEQFAQRPTELCWPLHNFSGCLVYLSRRPLHDHLSISAVYHCHCTLEAGRWSWSIFHFRCLQEKGGKTRGKSLPADFHNHPTLQLWPIWALEGRQRH